MARVAANLLNAGLTRKVTPLARGVAVTSAPLILKLWQFSIAACNGHLTPMGSGRPSAGSPLTVPPEFGTPPFKSNIPAMWGAAIDVPDLVE